MLPLATRHDIETGACSTSTCAGSGGRKRLNANEMGFSVGATAVFADARNGRMMNPSGWWEFSSSGVPTFSAPTIRRTRASVSSICSGIG
jgi:hypothetical protein